MEQPERMYRFFRDNGINNVGFNVEEQEGINTSSSMQGSEMEEKYRDFLRAFWRLSEQDGYPVVLREFEQVISCLLYTSPSPRDVEESRMPSSA